jgi:hypothetical protein
VMRNCHCFEAVTGACRRLHAALWLGQSATWHSLLQYLQSAQKAAG